MNIMEHTVDYIGTHITLLLYLLKTIAMIQMRLRYDKENIEENMVENIAIRCGNCGKLTGLSVKKIKITNTLSLN